VYGCKVKDSVMWKEWFELCWTRNAEIDGRDNNDRLAKLQLHYRSA
jgi:hypothetical protein